MSMELHQIRQGRCLNKGGEPQRARGNQGLEPDCDFRSVIGPRPPKFRRLTSREVRLVCSLINDGDRHFLEALLAHARADTGVAKAVVRGICRTPEMLTPNAAEKLLRLLQHQEPPKYARNLALEVIRTLEFANSFKVIEAAAEILATHIDTLSAKQSEKLLGRALAYPIARKFQPWPADRAQGSVHGEPEVHEVDFGGAVSILLLSKISQDRFDRRERKWIFKEAMWLARRFPDSENLWLVPLKEHNPRELLYWQTYLSGATPRKHLLGAIAQAAVATTLSWFALTFAFWVNGRPQPLGVLLASVTAISPVWGLRIVIAVQKKLGELEKRYTVPPTQAKQILDTTLESRSDGIAR